MQFSETTVEDFDVKDLHRFSEHYAGRQRDAHLKQGLTGVRRGSLVIQEVGGGVGTTQRERLPRRRVLCEGHLSLRPVTMATCCAQCRGEGGAGAMATQAVTATALGWEGEGRGGEGRGESGVESSRSLKETEAPQ